MRDKKVHSSRSFIAYAVVIMLSAGACRLDFLEIEAEATPDFSSIYPYGREFRLHKNSPSVNTPVRSSGILEYCGYSPAGELIEIPVIPDPANFTHTFYFDSEAPEYGTGTIESPYNSLKIIMDGAVPDNSALMLKAGSVFTSSFLRTNPDDEDIYFGSYGDGRMPIVTTVNSLSNPTSLEGYFGFHGNRITVDGIHIVGGAFQSYARVASIGAENLTIANSHIESIKTSFGYCHNIFKGGSRNTVLYNNEISYAREDIWYASSQGTYKIVSNYFHHANMGTYKNEGSARDRETWIYYKGDIIQFEYAGLTDTYIAGNLFDRSDSASKFALIFNGGHENSGITVEYNTFVGPLKAYGGAAVQWHTDGIFRNNLIINVDPEGGVSGLASYSTFGGQITSNHFVGYSSSSAFYNISAADIDDYNIIFESMEQYMSGTPPEDRKGSHLFTE